MANLLVMYDKHPSIPMVLSQGHIEQMQRCISGQLYWCGEESVCLEQGYDTEVLFLWGGTGQPPERYLSRSKNLKWIHTFSAGTDALAASPTLRSRPDILITNAKGIHGPVMALTTLGYIISFLRRFPELYRAQQDHVWKQRFISEPSTAQGKVVCVVGAGAIGTEVGKLCKAIGMYTIGVKRTICELPGCDEVLPNSRLNEALPRADFVVVVTPSTAETHHLINAERLSYMKSDAVLINIGRGPVVDTHALIDALERGSIGGAALDAFEEEPLPASSPLWDFPNVIVTPHCSAVNSQYLDHAVRQFCDLLTLYEAGKPLYNLVRLA